VTDTGGRSFSWNVGRRAGNYHCKRPTCYDILPRLSFLDKPSGTTLAMDNGHVIWNSLGIFGEKRRAQKILVGKSNGPLERL